MKNESKILLLKFKGGIRAAARQLSSDVRFRFQFIFICAAILILAAAGVYLTSQLAFARSEAEETISYTEETASHMQPGEFKGSNLLPISSWEENGAVVLMGEEEVTLTLKDNIAEYDLSAEVFPVILADRSLTWESQDPQIAAVDGNGHVTATAPGTTVIRAVNSQTGAAAECRVTVVQPVTGLYLATTTINMYTGASNQAIQAVITPENASNRNIIWNTSDPTVAMVDDTGTVIAVGAGTAVITASSEEGGYSAECIVTVSKPTLITSSPVTQVRILKKPSGAVAANSTFQMTTLVTGSKRGVRVNWTSSDPNVATVDENGVLRTISEGTVTITASGEDSASDSFILEVNNSSGRSYNTKLAAAQDENYSPSISISGNISGGSSSGGVYYTMYPTDFDTALKIQSSLSTSRTIWNSGSAQKASQSQIAQYMDPANFSTGAYKYQFLDLSKSNGVGADALNEFLDGKGVLSGQGDAFARTAQDYNISEVYLAAHAALESGNGTSNLARGVKYNGTTVYNVFGIGAVDSDPLNGGAKMAYEMGWTSVEKAIYGGAAWISEKYINSNSYQQNTLYKMLWNPAEPGVHQYASDVGWAVKQAVQIKKIFDNFPNAVLTYDVPVYSGMSETPLY